MTAQAEADMALSEAHKEQDKSHEQTVRWKEEMDILIEQAREGLHEKED